MKRLRVSFFGSSLGGAATCYRGILGALAQRGHHVVFYQPDAGDRQNHRDTTELKGGEVVLYSGHRLGAVEEALTAAQGSDLIVKASGVGVFDAFLEENVPQLRDEHTRVAFWDIDAPGTLERVRHDASDPFRALIPRYDAVFTYGGGHPVVAAYQKLGAGRVVPLCNGLDPRTHHPVTADPRFAGDLGLLANRVPDREARIDAFFFGVAQRLPQHRFVLGGSGWESKRMPSNVRYVGQVDTQDHNAFHCSTRAVLNVHRESMARMGYSPSRRVFEAAAAGACLISDRFLGAERFLRPSSEILLADDGAEVARLLSSVSDTVCRRIGRAALRRVLDQHTYQHRADTLEVALRALWPLRVETAEDTASLRLLYSGVEVGLEAYDADRSA